MDRDRLQSKQLSGKRLSGGRKTPNLINTTIEVRDGKGGTFGTLTLILCDVSEETIARNGWPGYFHANGKQGTAKEIFQFMAENFNVYESEFAGSMGFTLDIDETAWKRAAAGESFTANHFKNGETNSAALKLILRFLITPAETEPELDRAMRRVLTDVMTAQFPNLADAFGIGAGTITLDRTERRLLRQMAALGCFRTMRDHGIKTAGGRPIGEVIMEMVAEMSSSLPPGLTPDQLESQMEKIERLLPFYDEEEEEETEKERETI